VKAGTGGFAKNKGCVSLRFKIDGTSFAFINCHLQSGQGNVIRRVEQLLTVLDHAFLKEKGFPKTE